MPHLLFVTLALLFTLMSSRGQAENWPQFRGPTGQGVSQEPQVPVEWGPEKNIRWKVEVPGTGWSSPIYQNGRVYLTTAVPVAAGAGAGAGAGSDQQLTALCLDAATGSTIWRNVVFEQRHEASDAIHGKNSHASATPVVDAEFLYVHFGTHGTACLTLDGDVVWTNRTLSYRPQHGNGSSPVLVDDLLVVACDGADVQFVAALGRADGVIRWQQSRPPLTGKKFSFCTPLVIQIAGKSQIVSPGTDRVIAYRPADGTTIWQFDYTGYSVVPRPVYGQGLLFCSTSFDRPTLYALRPGTGKRDVEQVWETDRGAPHTASPLLVGEELYFVSDRGVATCVDAKTGKVHWVDRVGGNYSASPVYAGGLIYFQNEDGGTVVIRPGTEYREVTRNSLPGRTLASYAIADSAIFLRTDTHLYRIQNR